MGLLAGHRYVTREEWGATIPRSRFSTMPTPTSRLWIHHSADDRQGAAAVRAHEDYHVNTKGWRGIAYNFLIGSDGTIFEGRGAGIAGGATTGDNTSSHAICLLGNFETYGPSTAQWQALVDLARHGRDTRWWVPTCGGHRDAPGAQTACPGRHLYTQLPDLRHEITNPTIKEDAMALTAAEIQAVAEAAAAAVDAKIAAVGSKTRTGLHDLFARGFAAPSDQLHQGLMAAVRAGLDVDGFAAAVVAKLPAGTVELAAMKGALRDVLAEVKITGHLELGGS